MGAQGPRRAPRRRMTKRVEIPADLAAMHLRALIGGPRHVLSEHERHYGDRLASLNREHDWTHTIRRDAA